MSRRLALCTVLAALLWALPLQARGAAPVSRTSLPNGLVLLVQENPGEDIVAIELLVGVGLAQEGSNLEGIVHLLGQLLVNRITEDVSGADVVEVTGSLVTATSEPDYARLSIQTTSRHFPFMMRRLGAALRQRTLSEAEVAEVREDLLEEIRSSNKTFSALYGIFLENFYRYHPYRRTGTGSEASVQRLDASVVNPFFSKYYVPNRMVLSVAGRVDRVQVANLVRSELGGLAAVPQRSVDIQWEPRSAEKEVILAAGSRLAWVFLGFPAPGVRSQDYAPMRVIQSYLAEGLSS
ncbi:MAG TPA: pitrilysin family protein, partial [Candidatus Nitrosotenuis sp.]|nr:pitrilysin family protein [Candidatus Nitrosotenuis sp.]